MKRRLLYIIAAAFVLYLIASGLVAWYVQSEYLHDLRQELTGLGKDYLRQPEKLVPAQREKRASAASPNSPVPCPSVLVQKQGGVRRSQRSRCWRRCVCLRGRALP